LQAIPIIAVVAAGWSVRDRHDGWAFTATAIAIALTVISIFVDLYPNVMVSSTSSDNNLTVSNAASGNYAQGHDRRRRGDHPGGPRLPDLELLRVRKRIAAPRSRPTNLSPQLQSRRQPDVRRIPQAHGRASSAPASPESLRAKELAKHDVP
jgi:hypothetical protein